MKDFSYIVFLAQKGERASSPKQQLKIALQMEQLLRSTITELKIKVKQEGK